MPLPTTGPFIRPLQQYHFFDVCRCFRLNEIAMQPVELFRFCPRCAASRPVENLAQSPLRCLACGLVYYFNPTVAAAAFIADSSGRVLFIRRAKEPSAGKLGIPGGFIDFGESAEEGLCREVGEEVGVKIVQPVLLASFPNVYVYRDVSYPVVDLYFTAVALEPELARPLDGVAGIEWWQLSEVPEEELAFPSLRAAVDLLRPGHRHHFFSIR